MRSGKLLNFVLFQLGWFACVISSAAKLPLLGSAVAVAIIGWHLWRAQQPSREFYLIVTAMLIGVTWDSLLVWQAWLHYPAGILLPNTAPYWIVMLWALFATTLNLSLRWLKQHMRLAIVLGAVAGPLAYYGGARLGALDFVQPASALLALSIGWAVFTPLLILLSKRFDGYAVQPRRVG
jgi:hypothetical protein